MESIASKLENLVEEACKSENNFFGYGIWTHHITYVVENGKRLANLFNADPEIVEIAALLHDYAGIKDYSLHKDHHLQGAIEAENILKNLNYPDEKIETVKNSIRNHRGSVKSDRRIPEAECLATADAMAHIQNVSSLLYLAYVQRGMDIDEGMKWVREKIERSWKKINSKAKYLIIEDCKAAIKSLSNSTLHSV